jgi:hypothetical protein
MCNRVCLRISVNFRPDRWFQQRAAFIYLVAMIWLISSGENISHFVNLARSPSGSVGSGSYQYLGRYFRGESSINDILYIVYVINNT